MDKYTEAHSIYEILGTDPAVSCLWSTCMASFELSVFQTSSIYVLMQTAACLRMTDAVKDAAEVYEHGK